MVPIRVRGAFVALVLALVGVLVAACTSGSSKSTEKAGHITLYTSVTQNTVSAVVSGFQKEHPGAKVSVFRAPTGQMNARIAADQRSGGVKADVLWATDPLSMHGYDAQGLLERWTPSDLSKVPAGYRTNTFWGTRVLYLVIVMHKGLTPAPTRWSDLTSPAYKNAVVIPDPAFAGSALAALGYFDQAPGFGLDFYKQLKANGAVQISSIDDVVNGVAQGRYKLGIALEYSARAAIKKGSPIEVVWPSPGAIALYSPIGTVKGSANATFAHQFVEYVLSPAGQKVIGKTGWPPVLAGAGGPAIPKNAHTVTPNWAQLFTGQKDLLHRYQAIFG